MLRRLFFLLIPFIIVPLFSWGTSFSDETLEITNIKQHYCIGEKVTLLIYIPKAIPAKTNFDLYFFVPQYGSAQDIKYYMATTNTSSISFTIPVVWVQSGYFILQSADGKYKTQTSTFSLEETWASYSNILASDYAIKCDGKPNSLIYQQNRNDYTYQWQKNGEIIKGATKDKLDTYESGDYSLRINYNGCVFESNTLSIKNGEIPKPQINSLTESYGACDEFSIPLKVQNSFPYTKYEWKQNGKSIKTQDNNEIFDAKESGYYQVTTSQGLCSSTSDSVWIEIGKIQPTVIDVIDIEGPAPYFTKTSNNYYKCDSSSIILTNTNNYISGNNSNILYQWKLNNQLIQSSSNQSYLNTKKEGKYHLEITHGNCISKSNTIEVKNQNITKTKLDIHSPLSPTNSEIQLCNKDTLYVNKYIFGYNPVFYKDGVMIPNSSYYYPINQAGNYYLKATHARYSSCVVYSDTIKVKYANDNITLPTDTVYHCQVSLQLDAGWYPNMKKTWKFDSTIVGFAQTITVFNDGLYTLEIERENSCSLIKKYFVSNKPNTLLITNYDVNSLCSKIDYRLDASMPTYPFIYPTISWYKDNKLYKSGQSSIPLTENGNYYYTAKYNNCEATSNTITANFSKLNTSLYPNKDSLGICLNGGFQTLEANNEKGYSYNWYKNGTSLNENNYALKASQTGTYQASVEKGDCIELTPKVRIYQTKELPTATISGDTTVGLGETAYLKLQFTSSPPFSYTLSNNDKGIADKLSFTHPITANESASYQLVSVNNNCGEGSIDGKASIKVLILTNEPSIGKNISTFPVPSTDFCNLTINLPMPNAISYQLLTMNGQVLQEKNLGKVANLHEKIDIGSFLAGEYLLRIQIGNEFIARKLVKQ